MIRDFPAELGVDGDMFMVLFSVGKCTQKVVYLLPEFEWQLEERRASVLGGRHIFLSWGATRMILDYAGDWSRAWTVYSKGEIGAS